MGEINTLAVQVTDQITIAPRPFPPPVFRKLKPRITAEPKLTPLILP